MTAVVEIEGLTRHYGVRRALDQLDLTIESGQLLAFVGPNGSGKTTLFKIVAGLIGPTAGTVRLWGDGAWPRPPEVLARTAVVLDNHVPPAWARLQDLIELKAAAAPRFERAACQALLAESPGLHPRRTWGELSKGQRQWVLCATALASRADLLLLDEPGEGLDTAARRRLLGLLRAAVDDHGATVVVASHVLTDLERVADEVAILQEGRLRLHADLEALRDEVREVEFAEAPVTFAVWPEMAVLARRTLDDGEVCWLRHPEWETLSTELPGERARRLVGLEELYLAVTGPGAPPNAASAPFLAEMR